MRLESFFEDSSVFTTEEFKGFLKRSGFKSLSNYSVLLDYHIRRGRVLKICRGLYSVVPLNQDPETFIPDSFLVAAKRTSDSILAYHTAQEFYGNTYSLHSTRTFLTMRKIRTLLFRGVEYVPARPAMSLIRASQYWVSTEQVDIKGNFVFITNKERTFVDMLDRPNLSGGYEEAWRSLKMVEYLDTDKVLEYLKILDNATTAAKVGFFLQSNIEIINNDRGFLDELKRMIPASPHYIDRRGDEESKLAGEWNLVVPKYILNEDWEEQ